MSAFSARRLHDDPDALLRDIEAGQAAVLTQDDEQTPLGLVLPFPSPEDPLGTLRTLAQLVKSGMLSAGQAARVLDLSRLDFIDAMNALGIEDVWSDADRLAEDRVNLAALDR